MSYVSQNLMPGEEIRYRCGLSSKIAWGQILIYLLVSVIGYPIGGKFGIAWGSVFLGFALTSLLNLKTTEFAVTNKRVVIKTGILQRRSLEILLSKIESIGLDQSFFDRINKTGTIVVIGSGGTKEVFKFIDDPLKFRTQAHIQIDQIIRSNNFPLSEARSNYEVADKSQSESSLTKKISMGLGKMVMIALAFWGAFIFVLIEFKPEKVVGASQAKDITKAIPEKSLNGSQSILVQSKIENANKALKNQKGTERLAEGKTLSRDIYNPPKTGEPDASVASAAFDSVLPFGLSLGMTTEEVDEKIKNAGLKLLTTDDPKKGLNKHYSGKFAGMQAAITLMFLSEQLHEVDILVRPKASAVKNINVKFPRYIDEKFGAPSEVADPLYDGAGRIYTWLRVKGTPAGLMLSEPGPKDSGGALIFTYMAFH